MNGTLYSSPTFPNNINEENVIEERESDNLSNNKGKMIKAYFSFPNVNEIKEFNGRLESINKDYIVISNIDNNEYTLLFTKYLIYLVFDEKISL